MCRSVIGAERNKIFRIHAVIGWIALFVLESEEVAADLPCRVYLLIWCLRDTNMLPESITKPVSDSVIRGNRITRKLRGKLSPAQRAKAMSDLRKARKCLVLASKKLMSYQNCD